jgi:glutathione peroxidase
MNQEFACDADIGAFAKRQGAKFQIMQLSDVNGPNTIPLYSFLRSRMLKGSNNKAKMVPWNFTKFLLNGQGIPLKMFSPTDKPNLITSELERLCQ